MICRATVFSISDSLSASLLNISSEGVALGRGRLTAPYASLGEVRPSAETIFHLRGHVPMWLQVLQAGRVKSRVGKSLTLESLTG